MADSSKQGASVSGTKFLYRNAIMLLKKKVWFVFFPPQELILCIICSVIFISDHGKKGWLFADEFSSADAIKLAGTINIKENMSILYKVDDPAG